MEPIRVAWGSGVGPTAMSSFDAALADANCHEYNLVTLSSVIPSGATVERPGALPELGPVGDALPVVLSRETVSPGSDGTAVAGLGWVRNRDGTGLFYEDSGDDDGTVRQTIVRGLEHGTELRGWDVDPDPTVVTESRSAVATEHASAVVVAAYGTTTPLLAAGGPKPRPGSGDTQRG